MKKLLTLIAGIFLLYGNLAAQAPDTLWSRTISISPNGDIDDGKCVRQTTDGGFIITGATVPDGMVSCVDLLLLKTDESGSTEWIRTYGRDYVEEGLAVEQTADGGYIIAGRSLFITGSIPANDHQADAWLLKTGANGDTLWTRNYGGEGHEYFTSIVPTDDFGYIMTGTMNSERSYPNYEINDTCTVDSSVAWLVKTDQQGDTLWTRTFFDKSHANSVLQTDDGGYILTGWIFADGTAHQCDVLLVRTDSAGDTLWTKTIGEDDCEIGLAIRKTDDGYIIAGQTKPSYSTYDALLIKTDFEGNVVWTNTYGTVWHDGGFEVDVADDGGFFITGIANGNSWIHGGDMWVFKTDSGGNLLWENIYDMFICDYAWSGIQTSDRGFVVTGLLGYGFGGDLWLAKIAPESSGIIAPVKQPHCQEFLHSCPNPFNAQTAISFELLTAGEFELAIYNISGQRVGDLAAGIWEAGTHEVIWNAEGMANGIYFVKYTAHGQTSAHKLLLLK